MDNSDTAEHEVFGSGPEDLESANAWSKCTKNPTHESFIPVKDFTIQDLPDGCQDVNLLETLKGLCYLTVRLRVNATSRHRDSAYFTDSSSSVNDETRVGTGYVFHVDPTPTPCYCVQCSLEPEKRQTAWTFEVQTAKHVLFDDEEVLFTVVDMFYDSEESRTDGSLKSLRGVKVLRTDDKFDWCEFQCVTHDAEFAAEVGRKVTQQKTLDKRLIFRNCIAPYKQHPIFIVSHPHGRAKHITVGAWKGSKWLDGGGLQYTYSAATCPGGSGAVVWRLYDGLAGLGWPCRGVHHCMGGGVSGLNKGYLNCKGKS